MNPADIACLRTLAALLRAGAPLRRALLDWPNDLSAPSADVSLISTRVSLGIPATAALHGTAFESSAEAVALHLSHGIDLAGWLDATADLLEQDLASAASAKAAAAGAVLSGRMVAGLPLLFVPFAPMSRAMLDGPGVVFLLAGALLAVAGLRWIGTLVPAAPPPDRASRVCLSAAASLEAGLGIDAALVAALGDPAEKGAVTRMRRLGWSAADALAHIDPVYEPMCLALDRARILGLPAASTLRSVAESQRAAALRDFERRIRRAPVLMVVPLTCCVLPAYGLLGVVPFLRNIGLDG